MMKLRQKPHAINPRIAMCELIDEEGEMVAAIYATEEGLKIVSKHTRLGRTDLVTFDSEFPPAILVKLR